MSDNLSLVSKLKNKINYQIDQVVNDPEANKFAEEQKKNSENNSEKKDPPPDNKQEKFESSAPIESLNQISFSRIFSGITEPLKDILYKTLLPLLCLIAASYVTNDSIMYPYQIRIGFFIFTFFLCYIFTPYIFFIAFFYLGKKFYQYYNNELTDNPKIQLMPTFYSILPIMTNPPKSQFWFSIAKVLFLYGTAVSQSDLEKIGKTMKNYETDLHDSFPYIDTLKNKSPYEERLEKIKTNFEKLHKMMQPTPSNSTESTTSSNLNKSNPPLPPTIKSVSNASVPPTPTPTNSSLLPPTIASPSPSPSSSSSTTNSSSLPPTIPSTTPTLSSSSSSSSSTTNSSSLPLTIPSTTPSPSPSSSSSTTNSSSLPPTVASTITSKNEK
jgi:hypothetical protein